MEDKKYYIVSNKYANGLVRTFWREDNNGYTIDLGQAGLYKLDDRYPLITPRNIQDIGKYDTFYIAKEDISLLGKAMVCILN